MKKSMFWKVVLWIIPFIFLLFFLATLFFLNEFFELQAKYEKKNAELTEITNRVVTVTAYSSTFDQTDESPFDTACQTKVGPRTIAVSRDLYNMGWTCGQIVDLKNLGIFTIRNIYNDDESSVFTVNDKMHRRKDLWIDVWTYNRAHANRFGIKKNILVRLLNIREENTFYPHDEYN